MTSLLHGSSEENVRYYIMTVLPIDFFEGRNMDYRTSHVFGNKNKIYL